MLVWPGTSAIYDRALSVAAHVCVGDDWQLRDSLQRSGHMKVFPGWPVVHEDRANELGR